MFFSSNDFDFVTVRKDQRGEIASGKDPLNLQLLEHRSVRRRNNSDNITWSNGQHLDRNADRFFSFLFSFERAFDDLGLVHLVLSKTIPAIATTTAIDQRISCVVSKLITVSSSRANSWW